MDSHNLGSQQVSWWAVHTFVQRYLDTAGHYPPAGTPARCEMADGDRRKWAALLDFAQRHALRVETAQEQQCEASHDVSAAGDWSAIARDKRCHDEAVASGAYIPRKRVA